MPIIGFNLRKIEAEKKKNPLGKVNIANTPKILKMESMDMNNNLSKDLNKAIRVEYEFITEYEPKIGSIKFEGDLVYFDPKQDEILKAWKKDKSIPEMMMLEILNYMFRKFITKSLSIAEELQLPPSIPFPSAQVGQPQQQKNPKYIE